MPAWNAFSYVFGPLVAFAGIGLLVLVLRWAFRRGDSLVERPGAAGEPTDYGLLVPVAEPADFEEGERLRRSLEGLGVRTTLAATRAGPRLLVFPADAERARLFLGGGRG